jgi:hypothetical protein
VKATVAYAIISSVDRSQLRCFGNPCTNNVASIFALRCRTVSTDAAFGAQPNAFDVHSRHDENFAERERMTGSSSDPKHG